MVYSEKFIDIDDFLFDTFLYKKNHTHYEHKIFERSALTHELNFSSYDSMYFERIQRSIENKIRTIRIEE
ncbi:hypothetical protein RIEPE_0477 [Candidatus Riesia pediculicola USDA]|uniref:Uncharacterized protein n=1 Tax=Riesia pediculicola (strain USDA) TaxID=515618 RepID=D4G8Q7_RIEPU|nr:hypothetical protein RIEPE_0477 [Candidatus Riesia pediculicola USDA]ARC53930.1 hypothetical protein AOE55_02115 [Candidatus Riesia pediculicola]